MDNRRRTVLLAAGASIIASMSVVLKALVPGSLFGLPSDFWHGFAIGLSMTLAIAALAFTARSRSTEG
jgi:hypothetical protein